MELKLLGRHASTYCYNPPSKINVDITGYCNLNCVWCSRKFVDIPEIHMDFRVAEHLFNWMKNPKIVTFAGFGEPLMYPIEHLVDLINMASKKAKVQIITNGTLLKGKIADRIGNSKLHRLIVSVDSADPETYKRIRGYDLEKVKENIADFTMYYDTPVFVNAVAFMGEKSNWDDFKTLTGVKDIRFKPLKESKFSRDAGFMPDPNCTIKNKHTCYQPFYEFNIGVDQRFYPCCTCRTMGTDIPIKQFDKVWNGNWIRQFRRSIIQHYPPHYCRDWCKLQ